MPWLAPVQAVRTLLPGAVLDTFHNCCGRLPLAAKSCTEEHAGVCAISTTSVQLRWDIGIFLLQCDCCGVLGPHQLGSSTAIPGERVSWRAYILLGQGFRMMPMPAVWNWLQRHLAQGLRFLLPARLAPP